MANARYRAFAIPEMVWKVGAHKTQSEPVFELSKREGEHVWMAARFRSWSTLSVEDVSDFAFARVGDKMAA